MTKLMKKRLFQIGYILIITNGFVGFILGGFFQWPYLFLFTLIFFAVYIIVFRNMECDNCGHSVRQLSYIKGYKPWHDHCTNCGELFFDLGKDKYW